MEHKSSVGVTDRRLTLGNRRTAMHGDALTVRFSFEGAFGLEDAKRAVGQLEGAEPGTEVLLDLSRCAHVDASGVALISQAVARQGGAFQALGLTRHDLRILHYLGVSIGDEQGLRLDDD